jgi:superfamily II DNA or RNA helicase
MSILRPYQRQAITAAWAAITPDTNRVAIEMATGLGKTITFAAMVDEWLKREHDANNVWLTKGDPNGTWETRALILVERDELVRQTVAKLATVTRGRWTIGVVQADRDEVAADIIVASVATLRQPGRMDRITDVGLIIVDECHHAVASSYLAILRHFGALPSCTHPYTDMGHCFDCRDTGFTEPPIPTFGFTATLARSDGQGLGQVWQDLAFSRSLSWGMRHGYLIDLVPYTIKIPGLTPGAGDAALDAQLADSIAPEAVVQAWLEKTFSVKLDTGQPEMYFPRPSTVLFAPLVRSAEAFAEAFNAAGVKAEVVAGAYSDDHNLAVKTRFEAGVTTVVCNAMKWTEGVDIPRIGCIVWARPLTKLNGGAPPIFIQGVGRGLRPWLDAEAPPRDQQRCVLLTVQGEAMNVATVADLSDKIGEVVEGKSFLAMEDEFDLGKDIPADEDNAYRGPVRVEQWDALVQASSKAWKYTAAGVPFLPTMKRGNGYVFIVQTPRGHEVWSRMVVATRKAHNARLATAPDLELAMALAEDEAQERGGDIGALLADKTRPWRKAVPSLEAIAEARRAGVDEAAIARVLSSKAAGKAGKLSDLIDTVTATRVLDGNAAKIKERA